MEGKWVELKDKPGVYGYIVDMMMGYTAYKVRVCEHGTYTDKKIARSSLHIVDKSTLSERDKRILRDEQINLALAINDREWLKELAEEMEGSK